MRSFCRSFGLVIAVALTLVGCDLIRTSEECTADLEDMQSAVQDAVESGGQCQRDTDCAAFNPSNNCFASCPVALNTTEMPRVQEEILRADALYCRNFAEQCGYSTPSCPTLEPVCQQGQCVLIDRTEGP